MNENLKEITEALLRSVHAADPTRQDVVIVDLYKQVENIHSHITKLEADNAELKADVIESEKKQNIQELYIIGLEARNKKLEEALKDIVQIADWGNLKHNLPFKNRAEQALNKK